MKIALCQDHVDRHPLGHGPGQARAGGNQLGRGVAKQSGAWMRKKEEKMMKQNKKKRKRKEKMKQKIFVGKKMWDR